MLRCAMNLMNLEITNHFCLLGGNRTETTTSRLGSHEIPCLKNGLTLETTKQSSSQQVFLALPVPKSGRKNFQFSTGAAAWDAPPTTAKAVWRLSRIPKRAARWVVPRVFDGGFVTSNTRNGANPYWKSLMEESESKNWIYIYIMI